MEPNLSKKSPASSEEEECSSDEERSDGRRRRFCVERVKQSTPDNELPTKRARMEPNRNRPGIFYRACGARRQRTSHERLKQPEPDDDQPRPIEVITDSDRSRANNYYIPRASRRRQQQHHGQPHHPQQHHLQPSHPQQHNPQRHQSQEYQKVIPVPIAPPEKKEQETKGSVIFINPKFVKKFIEKSIKLTSSSSTATNSSSASMIDNIDFKTSPKESVQAASTMAIIRLVTECIEDDSKRDEKLNKILVSRLVTAMQNSVPTDKVG